MTYIHIFQQRKNSYPRNTRRGNVNALPACSFNYKIVTVKRTRRMAENDHLQGPPTRPTAPTFLDAASVAREMRWVRIRDTGGPPGGFSSNASPGKSTRNAFPGRFPGNSPPVAAAVFHGEGILLIAGLPRGKYFTCHRQATRHQQSYREKARLRRPSPLNFPADGPDIPIQAAFFNIIWKLCAHLAAAGLMRGRG